MKKHTGLHVIYGDDDYRKSAAIRALIEQCVPAELRDFNYNRLEGSEVDEEDIYRIAQTPPLLAERRMLHIDETERLSSSALSALTDVIDAAIERDMHDVVLLLVYSSEKKPPKSITKRAGQAKELKPLRWRDAQNWIIQYAQDAHGIRLSNTAAQALLRALGPSSSGRLANEVDKLQVLAGNAPITAQLVADATGVQVGKSIFDLCDSVGNRDVEAACAILEDVLHTPNNSAIGSVVLLGRHLLDIGIARAMLDRGVSPGKVAEKFGWTGKKIVAQAERWTTQALDRAISLLADTDLRLKTTHAGPQGEWRALNMFLISALRQKESQ